MTRRVLIACIGNIFLGDDAFGVEVARRLAGRAWPEGVQVTDFGIRGMDLAYALVDGYDTTIFVDAAPRGEAPGTLYLIEPDTSAITGDGAAPTGLSGHGLDPVAVLGVAKMMGASFGRLLVVGCEPATLGPDEGYIGLSEPVAAAVDEAVAMIKALVADAVEPSDGGAREQTILTDKESDDASRQQPHQR